MSGSARVPLGAAGRAIANNVDRLRRGRNWSYEELASRLDEVGRRIPALGLRRIISGDRRVDVDELVAFGSVFNCEPAELLNEFLADEYRADCLRWLLAEMEHNR